MSDLANILESYKLRSRRYRNKALQLLQDGDAEQAAIEFKNSRAAMDQALRYLQDLGVPDLKGSAEASEGEIEVVEQLADCWGIIGGVHRAEGNLSDATDAYDKGYIYESSKRFNILNTYNRVNRLVTRVLQNPALLSPEEKTMPELLNEAAEEIERQLGEGRKDRAWALADLAMVRLLTSVRVIDSRVDLALDALDESSANDHFPYHSTLKVIRELAQRQLPLPMKDKLIAVGERLRRKLPQTMQGEALTVTVSNG